MMAVLTTARAVLKDAHTVELVGKDRTVTADKILIAVGGKAIKVFAERDPANLPWGALDIDVVMECTGHFTKRSDAEKHLAAGAKRVLAGASVAPTEEKLRRLLRVSAEDWSAATSSAQRTKLLAIAAADLTGSQYVFAIGEAQRDHAFGARRVGPSGVGVAAGLWDTTVLTHAQNKKRRGICEGRIRSRSRS